MTGRYDRIETDRYMVGLYVDGVFKTLGIDSASGGYPYASNGTFGDQMQLKRAAEMVDEKYIVECFNGKPKIFKIILEDVSDEQEVKDLTGARKAYLDNVAKVKAYLATLTPEEREIVRRTV